MIGILDNVAKSHLSEFKPSTADEYFVLQLAKKLGDPAAAPHYVVLASQYSEAALLCAYRKALEINPSRPAAMFHQILKSFGGHGSRATSKGRIMAIRIERRAVAMALFAGTQLEGWRVRQLPSDSRQTEDSCIGFVSAVLDEHHCDGVVLEEISGEAARTKLHTLVTRECADLGISVTEIAKQTVIESFAHPAPAARRDVREIASQVWLVPSLKGGRDFILDAAALGLYLQTERLFAHDSRK